MSKKDLKGLLLRVFSVRNTGNSVPPNSSVSIAVYNWLPIQWYVIASMNVRMESTSFVGAVPI